MADAPAKILELGTFEVNRKRILVMDPCQPRWSSLHVWFQTPPNPSVWRVTCLVYDNSEKFAELICRQPEFKPGWHQVGEVEVDSGQIGVFCDEHYHDNKLGLSLLRRQIRRGSPFYQEDAIDDKHDAWYLAVCNLTTGPDNKLAAVLPFGCVCRTGADGVFPVYADGDSGEVGDIPTGIRIVM